MAGTVARRGDAGTLEVVQLDNYPALAHGVGGLAEVMDDNVGRRLQLGDLTRITVPTGGATSFEIFDDLTRETENVKYVEGVLVHWRRSRAWWPPTDNDELSHEPPSCASVDGKFPIPNGEFGDGGAQAHRNIPIMVDGEQRRSCAKCPMSQWGSHPKEGRNGQACKAGILLFLLQEGETLPVVISVPPTSIKVVENFMVKLSARYATHYSGFKLRFALAKIDKGPNPYSQLVPSQVGVLDGVAPNGKPDPNSPAGIARLYADEFSQLLTVEDLIEAATGNSANNGSVINGEVLPDDLGGDFAEHEIAEPALS